MSAPERSGKRGKREKAGGQLLTRLQDVLLPHHRVAGPLVFYTVDAPSITSFFGTSLRDELNVGLGSEVL